MVIVVVAALIRNAWDWWNLRKHVRILKQQQAETAKLFKNHPSVRERRRKSQVPFGVRAIQSGIEVEGVWISRPNSVVNSPSTTTPSSPMALQPRYSLGDKLAAAVREKEKEDEYNNMTVATAARQLEAQTAGGKMVAPRAARDPFRDGLTPSERSGLSDTSEVESYYNRRSMGPVNAYHDMPQEEAGYANRAAGPSATHSRHASKQAYLAEPAYQADYFSGPVYQPQTYVPSRPTEPRISTHNTYVPEAPSRPAAARRQSSFGGYSYPQGYAQAYGSQTDNGDTSPTEMDIGESYGGDLRRPERSYPTSNAPGRRSDYGLIFSDTSPQSAEAQSSRRQPSAGYTYGQNHSTTPPSPPEHHRRTSDPFATPVGPLSQSRRNSAQPPAQQSPWPLPPQATNRHAQRTAPSEARTTTTTRTTTMHAPVPNTLEHPTFRDRDEAEAEALSMRHVNEGFSVARHGQRRDTANLAAAGQAAEAKGPVEGQKKERKRLQKRGGRADDGDKRPSQFKEDI